MSSLEGNVGSASHLQTKLNRAIKALQEIEAAAIHYFKDKASNNTMNGSPADLRSIARKALEELENE